MEPVHVFKFGGTSVATPERIQRVVQLVLQEPATVQRVVVVSALGGVTDQLLQAVEAALGRTGEHKEIVKALRARHGAAVDALADAAERASLQALLDERWTELGELLDGVYLLRECTPRTRDAIIGMGERMAAPLTAAAFRAAGADATALDATEFIRTDAAFGEANVQFDVTNKLIRDRFEQLPAGRIAVITGFIASTDRGVTTTLGRSGSDYTATILGGALGAARVVIWTDVDGVLSADPRLVPEAFPLPQLNYREAAELAFFGAKVLHPRTMRPLKEQRIPLYIKNTLNSSAPGTLISEESMRTDGHVKAVTAIRNVAMVMLEGTGMVGVPGISARAFGALAARLINVLLISQASSEQSICIVVRESEGEAAVQALEEVFSLERTRGDVSDVTAVKGCAVVSAVGDYMRERPGLAGRMFATLGRTGVNVLAIAEGASETNISAVVRDAEVEHAMRALHEVFSLDRNRAHVFLIGTGVIGRKLLELLGKQAPVLLEQLNLNLQLVGVANTRRLLWDVNGIPVGEALDRLEASQQRSDNLDALVRHLTQSRLERLIAVDATASDAVTFRYPELLANQIAVITPNKRANTRDLAFYQQLKDAARRARVPYFYETTVGAGLPVISTLRDLLRSGDEIQRIEGIFSGTLAFIFNNLAEGCRFSEAVRLAREAGYTEPDPRDDLSGEDVARKLLTLAREMGLPLERSDVAVESLVPASLQHLSVEAFMDQLETFDAAWQDRVAAAKGRCLHYVGLIEEGRLSVGVRAVDASSPFARLQGTDNMVVYTTARYRRNPLVVQGPGAGPDVTAAGILADVIKAAELVA